METVCVRMAYNDNRFILRSDQNYATSDKIKKNVCLFKCMYSIPQANLLVYYPLRNKLNLYPHSSDF